MTLEELIITNGQICKIYADVRDYSNGKNGYLIKSYHIGPFEREDRFADPEHGILPRWKAISAAINYKDIGRDYWGIITRDIPKNLMKMQVANWCLWDGWRTNNGLDKHQWLQCSLVGKDDVLTINCEDAPVVNKWIEGQMDISEFIRME